MPIVPTKVRISTRTGLKVPQRIKGSAQKSYYGSSRSDVSLATNPVSRNIPRKSKTMSAKPLAGYRTAKKTKQVLVRRKSKMSTLARAKLSKRIGQTVTVGPLFYSLKSLSACPAKCTLNARDSAGLSLKIIFFKVGYKKKLRVKKGRAIFTGLVTSGGKSLILRSIR